MYAELNEDATELIYFIDGDEEGCNRTMRLSYYDKCFVTNFLYQTCISCIVAMKSSAPLRYLLVFVNITYHTRLNPPPHISTHFYAQLHTECHIKL